MTERIALMIGAGDAIGSAIVRKFAKIWEMVCFAGFLCGREAARYMTRRERGTILFTGATASVRGAAGFAANYVMLYDQPRNAWTFELDIRPWIERW